MSDVDLVVLTAEEKRFLYFFPPAFGGTQPPDSVRASLETKGLVGRGSDGRYWMTVKGDHLRQGKVPSRVEG